MPRLSALAFSMGTYGLTRGVSGFGAIYSTQNVFKASTSFLVPAGTKNIDEYFVLGGGGGGGLGRGGGGGAGGFITGTNHPVTPRQTISVVVGSGGAKGTPSGPGDGTNGQESSFDTIKANGGGGGGGLNRPGLNGGCGGGGASSSPSALKGLAQGPAPANTIAEFPVGQGFDGGSGTDASPLFGAGGGGGCGQRGGFAGPNPLTPVGKPFSAPYFGGRGGLGTQYTMKDNVIFSFGGGGNGGGQNNSPQVFDGGFGGGITNPTPWADPITNQQAKLTNGHEGKGGGGGGDFFTFPNPGQTGNGGSGAVIIKYSSSVTEEVFILTDVGTFTIPEGKGFNTLEYLVVAGGGGGGKQVGGGGGAGGLRTGTGISVTGGQVVTYSVGGGGNQAPNSGVPFVNATNGNDSFLSIGSTHIGTNGGGFGAIMHPGYYNAGHGGCGGGASTASGVYGNGDTGTISGPVTGENTSRTPVVQGFRGGSGGHPGDGGAPFAGGGGGAASVGFSRNLPGGTITPTGDRASSNGGNAFISTISGTTGSYAGGGAGGWWDGGSHYGGGDTRFRYSPQGPEPMTLFGSNAMSGNGGGGDILGPLAPQFGGDGAPNTGGGGSGNNEYPGAGNEGGQGGSGIIILKLTRS